MSIYAWRSDDTCGRNILEHSDKFAPKAKFPDFNIPPDLLWNVRVVADFSKQVDHFHPQLTTQYLGFNPLPNLFLGSPANALTARLDLRFDLLVYDDLKSDEEVQYQGKGRDEVQRVR